MPSGFPPPLLHGLYRTLFLLLPWSVELHFGSWNLLAPTEPLLLLCGLGLLATGWRQQRRLVPRGLAGFSAGWIAWLALAASTSSMPLVSLKYWVVEAGHWGVFMLGLYWWPALWPQLIRILALSMAGAVLYALVHHGQYQFRADQASLSPMPFFSDHTLYSAVLVMLLLLLPQIHWKQGRWLPWALGSLYVLGLSLAVSRAAWLSLLLAGALGLAWHWRWSWRAWAVAVVLVLGAGAWFQHSLARRLAADVSSQERLNRYACAWRMAGERPWLGFGPGTFAVQYLPFQRAEDMTRISIRAPIVRRSPDNYGRGGGAHSEYWQALVELGWPGLALWLGLVLGSLGLGWQQYRQRRDTAQLFRILALLSFFLHALVNNFLHDARVAALVWGILAIIAQGACNKTTAEAVEPTSVSP
ncbi:MAG: O-antigen ligase family protein [Saprospiraceae bacterium]|nr:O-antigen ligase family protein [Saprospiraceae bacterium]